MKTLSLLLLMFVIPVGLIFLFIRDPNLRLVVYYVYAALLFGVAALGQGLKGLILGELVIHNRFEPKVVHITGCRARFTGIVWLVLGVGTLGFMAYLFWQIGIGQIRLH